MAKQHNISTTTKIHILFAFAIIGLYKIHFLMAMDASDIQCGVYTPI